MVDKIMGGKGFGPLDSVKRSGRPAAEKKSSAGASDRVDFSSALKEASDVQAAGSTQKSARAEKLQMLKEQIANGTYRPDLGKVASSVLPFIMKDS